MELGIPSDEDDIVDHLVEAKVISGEIGTTVKRMKGFRNFIVHRYGGIDDKIAFENIKTGFGDFRKFEGVIRKVLGKGD